MIELDLERLDIDFDLNFDLDAAIAEMTFDIDAAILELDFDLAGLDTEILTIELLEM